MAKKNTVTIRADAEFKQLIEKTIVLNRKRTGRDIKAPRVTKAMLNQYKKYPHLLKELLSSDLTK